MDRSFEFLTEVFDAVSSSANEARLDQGARATM